MRAVFYDTVFFLFKFGILITVFGGVCTGVEYQWHFSPPVPPEAVINVTISDNSTTNGTNSTLEGTDNGFTSLEDELASLEAEDTITFINGTWEDVNGTLVWSNISLPVDTNVRNPKEEKLFRGKKIGKLFLGHVFKEISTTHLPTQCAFECLQHVNCRSYNFNQKNHSCTLNDATHVEHYNSLVENEAFTYYVRDSYHVNKDALGLCMTYPCQNNGYCLDIKTQQGLPSYICICPEGWTGINCDTNADDIDWSEWQAWESCSVTCGTGWKQRRRSCVNKATLEDRSPLDCYGAEVESETCTLLPCPEWDSWSTWSPCSTHYTCGAGIKTRHRSCANRGTPGKDRYCMGPLIEHAPCHEVTCTAPVNLVDGNEYGQGVLQIYNDKSKTWGMVCSEGWGINEATVACRQLGLAGAAEALQNGPTKSYNLPFVLSGLSCLGNETAIQECTHNGWQSSSLCKDGHVVGIKCVVDGGWGDWSSWGECSVTCEDGIRIRTRQCDHPETLRGGQPCDGVAQQEKPCTLPPCPVHGVWLPWTEWGTCNVSCGGGQESRQRLCQNPLHGGDMCQGKFVQYKDCNTHHCPVAGVWDTWGKWASCSVSCGGGQQGRTRVCYGPFYGGEDCPGSPTDTRACNEHNCPIDGVWQAWSEWFECTVSCGNGTQMRNRSCYGPFYNGTDCIGDPTDVQECNTHQCPVDGVWKAWSEWETCSLSCGGGTQGRSRECDGPFYHGQNCSGPFTESRACNTHNCPIDGVWVTWSAWGTCNTTCGGGIQSRWRVCDGPFFGGANCSGPTEDFQACNTHHCPVDGVWTNWTSWDTCNVTCGGGMQHRYRTCTGPFYGGLNCSGPDIDSKICNDFYCPVDGIWEAWTEWNSCNVSCGGGIQSRQRSCDGPFYGGANCSGPAVEYQDCHTHPCPIHGYWGVWSEWSTCNVSCGGGQQSRVRDCIAGLHGGSNCTGSNIEYQDCNPHHCPIDGKWRAWSAWTNCSGSCGTGQRSRFRTCAGPYYGGRNCTGDASQVEACNVHECPVDGIWKAWSNWTNCDVSCGGGTQNRTRECDGPYFLGEDCHGPTEEVRNCNTHECAVDGVWGNWTAWDTCSTSCGNGTQWRYRGCIGPFFGGKECQGNWNESQACNTHHCPVDGVFTSWSEWSNCTVQCGGGTRWKDRTCDGPYHGGKNCEGAWSESETCNTHKCPIDGVWGNWTEWTVCTVTCGGGIQNRSRDCDGPYYGGANCSGAAREQQECNTHPCPIDGQWNEWSEWGQCSVSCGGGEQDRTRTCSEVLYGGQNCTGNTTDVRQCNTHECPVDGIWSNWTEWSECSHLCGGGEQWHSRECIGPFFGGADCDGPANETRACNEHNCPVDGQWLSWSTWAICTASCGGGTQRRSRMCMLPRYGGQMCEGESTQTGFCNDNPCPVDGAWSLWTRWFTCNVTCGGGIQRRYRSCAAAQHGGKSCEGDSEEFMQCNTHNCPVDGVWQEWTAWEACSRECGGGMQSRNRVCDGPYYGGLACQGPKNDSRACNEHACPVDGSFSLWSDWGQCSVSCNGGIQWRSRECWGVAHGGADCVGARNQSQECNVHPCPVDGVFTQWSEWETCNVTCGGGTQNRERTCDGPFHGGQDCIGALVDTRDCNTHHCPVDGVFEEWSEWDACDLSCGGGIQWRYRQCTGPFYGGEDCVGSWNSSQPCNTHPCPVDGVWRQWSNWDNCSVSCGGGIQWRYRDCDGPYHKGRDCEGSWNESQACNSHPCPIDGEFSDWSSWGGCSVSCGGGTQGRHRVCVGPFFHGRECEGDFNETQACNVHECPVDGVFVQWSEWYSCSLSCGGGQQHRNRTCTGPFYGGKDCEGPWNQTQPCNTHHCPVDGVFDQWLDWGPCSVSCGGGNQNRSRVCIGPFYGGADCQGPSDESRACNEHNCPVDGVFDPWAAWGECTVSCGGGTQMRERVCNGPFFGGAECDGPLQDSRDCNTHHCPVDGIWKAWGEWGTCTLTCGGGQRSRTRQCDGPYYGGKDCVGPVGDTGVCNPQGCPIPGDWMEWSPWGECSATCGGGIRYSTRVCDMESYGNLTIDCIGNNTKTGPCHVFSCDPALNCEDWVRRGLTVSTYGPIDPDGPDGFVQPFTVFCNITEERAYTVVGHNNEEPVQVIGYEGAGEYQLALIYGSPGFPPVSALQLAFLVDTSTECKQFISWKCYSATIHHPTSREIVTTFWANRDGEFRYYWGGAPPGSDMCACGVNGTCHKPGTVCNCDANDATWREDAGWITYKPDLPVTDFYAGDTGNDGEQGYHYFGPLVCHFGQETD